MALVLTCWTHLSAVDGPEPQTLVKSWSATSRSWPSNSSSLRSFPRSTISQILSASLSPTLGRERASCDGDLEMNDVHDGQWPHFTSQEVISVG